MKALRLKSCWRVANFRTRSPLKIPPVLQKGREEQRVGQQGQVNLFKFAWVAEVSSGPPPPKNIVRSDGPQSKGDRTPSPGLLSTWV